MVTVFVLHRTTRRQEFSVIVSRLRNITMCLSECQSLMAILTYEEVEDKLHIFLTTALDADGCSPSRTGSLTSSKAPPLSESRKKPIGGLAVTVRGENLIFP